jgi:hypothetical protein
MVGRAGWRKMNIGYEFCGQYSDIYQCLSFLLAKLGKPVSSYRLGSNISRILIMQQL